MKAIDAVSPAEVRFTLNHVDAAFPSYLAAAPGFIPSMAAAQKAGKDFGQALVGTGPFKLVRWESCTGWLDERDKIHKALESC